MRPIATIIALTTIILADVTNTRVIGFKEAKRIFTAKSALFIDAREAKFYKKGTILGALNIPLKRFRRIKGFLPVKKSAKMVLFCAGVGSNKSTKLSTKIANLGYSHILIFKDGYPKWKELNQPAMLSSKLCRNNSYKPIKKVLNNTILYLGTQNGSVDAKWLKKRIQEGTLDRRVEFVDVRIAKEYNKGHIKGAKNIIWSFDNNTIDSKKFNPQSTIILYCNTGIRSSEAYDSLTQELKKRVLYLDAVVKCKGNNCKIIPN